MTEQRMISSNTQFGFSNNQLKMLAMVTMLIDHVGEMLLPNLLILRVIGRIPFPIFAYMIAEGCRYTKNRVRYLSMIACLGLACQAVYFIFMKTLYFGILITFSLSILSVYCIDAFIKGRCLRNRICMVVILLAITFFVVVMPVLFAEQGFRLDYGICGVLLPVVVYYARDKTERIAGTATVLIIQAALFNSGQWFALLALPFLFFYNGHRGRARLKYLFYVFYPSHLVAIYLIAMWMGSRGL